MSLISKKNVPDMKPLKIIIVGGGKVGHTLVDQLSSEGNNVTLIDTDPDVISDITNEFDVFGYLGNGASYSILRTPV